MESVDRAGFAGYSENWAEDHVEADFTWPRAVSRALEQDSLEDSLETTDDEWFEDDLLSLIQNRPSRHPRRPASTL
jgi:hypothetical protein